MDFFISYTSLDKAWAEWIAWQLEETGYTTVNQAWDFLPGSNFVRDMQHAIEDSQRTIAILSSHYLSSRFTQAEWMAAFAKDPTGQSGLLLPIRVDECNPKGLLPQIVYINLAGLNEMDARSTLLQGVSRRRAKPAQTPPFPRSAKSVQGQTPPFPGNSLRPQESCEMRNNHQFPTSSDNQVDTLTHIQEIELTIHGKFEDYREEDQVHLLQAIAKFLQIDGTIHITNKRKGSIKITLALSPEQAEALLWATKRGKFEAYGVIEAELKEVIELSSIASIALRKQASVDFPFEMWTNSIGMKFVRIPAGTFTMGSPDSDTRAFFWERPAHRVTLSQPFSLGIYPVTQAQWESLMGNNPSRFQGYPNHPVERVSWNDVQAFMQKLNEREGVQDYHLPTEAQWEYACRAGSSGAYCFGDEEGQLGEYAWYSGNSGGTTHPVGQKQPNAWGLYDMHGNVWEWVEDWYGPYTAKSVADPNGADAGAGRVFRGGGWGLSARLARSAGRSAFRPGFRSVVLGFRCLSSASSQ